MRYPARLVMAISLTLCFGDETNAQNSSAGTLVVDQPWAPGEGGSYAR